MYAKTLKGGNHATSCNARHHRKNRIQRKLLDRKENTVCQRRSVTENFQKRFYAAKRRTVFCLRKLPDRLIPANGDGKNTFDAERNVVRDRTVCTAVSPHFDLGKCSGPLPDRTRGRRGDRRRDQRRAQLYQPVYHQRNKVRLAEDTHFRVYARCYVFDLFSDRAGDPFRRCLSKTIFAF